MTTSHRCTLSCRRHEPQTEARQRMYMYHKGMDGEGMFHGIYLCSSSLGVER